MELMKAGGAVKQTTAGWAVEQTTAGEAVEQTTAGEAVEQETVRGGVCGPGRHGSGPGCLREDLLDLLRQKEVRRKMNEALLREATGEAKSTGVIRAYELVQKILHDAGEDVPVDELDLRQFSDSRLREMIARIRRDADGPAEDETPSYSGGGDGNAVPVRDAGRDGGDGNAVPVRDAGRDAGRDGGDGHGQPETD